MYKVIRTKEYLSHHGILGQKWGVRNGPPYPIGSSSKSTDLKIDLQFFAKTAKDYPTIRVDMKEYAKVMNAAMKWIEGTKEKEESFHLDVDGLSYIIDNTIKDEPRIIGRKYIPEGYTDLFERNDYN